jgi:hypothetical protein
VRLYQCAPLPEENDHSGGSKQTQDTDDHSGGVVLVGWVGGGRGKEKQRKTTNLNLKKQRKTTNLNLKKQRKTTNLNLKKRVKNTTY